MSKKTISPTFTQDWFSRSIPGWQFILARMAEKTPNLRILEVGVFEGRSTCWLLENFCKTPEATIVAIDSFQGGIEHQNMELGGLRKQFEDNIASVGSPAKVEVRAGLSLDQLCRLVAENTEPFDFISVDASHQSRRCAGRCRPSLPTSQAGRNYRFRRLYLVAYAPRNRKPSTPPEGRHRCLHDDLFTKAPHSSQSPPLPIIYSKILAEGFAERQWGRE